MPVPGGNILAQAMSVISGTAISYRPFLGRVLNEMRQYVDTYGQPVTVYGSVQPVPRNLYDQYGLDFQKSYVTLYVQRATGDLKRGAAGDQFVWNNGLWKLESNTEWFSIDGWNSVICVYVGDPNSDE
jgi:hypothetical protein